MANKLAEKEAVMNLLRKKFPSLDDDLLSIALGGKGSAEDAMAIIERATALSTNPAVRDTASTLKSYLDQ